MTICPKCNKRLAKRPCPALGDALCNLCCGLLREKELHCPSSCRHLSSHKHYQEKRILEKGSPASVKSSFEKDELLKDERMAWLIFQMESSIRIFAAASSSLSDREILLAMDYVREKIEKGQSLLVLPGENLKPKNDLGESVFRAAENARWESSVILSPRAAIYKKEEKLRCLDRIIRSIKSLAQSDPGGTAYLRNLAERFARIQGLSEEKKLIIPG